MNDRHCSPGCQSVDDDVTKCVTVGRRDVRPPCQTVKQHHLPILHVCHTVLNQVVKLRENFYNHPVTILLTIYLISRNVKIICSREHFLATRSNSSFLLAESTSLAPHLAS